MARFTSFLLFVILLNHPAQNIPHATHPTYHQSVSKNLISVLWNHYGHLSRHGSDFVPPFEKQKKWQHLGNISGPVQLVLPGIYPASAGGGRGNRVKNTKKWQHLGNTFIQQIEKNRKNGNPLETLLQITPLRKILFHFFGNKMEQFYQPILYQLFIKHPTMKTATFYNNSPLSGNKYCFHSTELDTKPTKIMENHQGLYAGQRSSNVVHSGQHPFPLKLKVSRAAAKQYMFYNRVVLQVKNQYIKMNFYFSLHTPQPPLSYI